MANIILNPRSNETKTFNLCHPSTEDSSGLFLETIWLAYDVIGTYQLLLRIKENQSFQLTQQMNWNSPIFQSKKNSLGNLSVNPCLWFFVTSCHVTVVVYCYGINYSRNQLEVIWLAFSKKKKFRIFLSSTNSKELQNNLLRSCEICDEWHLSWSFHLLFVLVLI